MIEIFKGRTFDPLEDGVSVVDYISHMGSDLDIVNDARYRGDRVSDRLSDKDKRLIRYLLSANPIHGSPLRGSILKVKMKAPLFLARQFWKHAVSVSSVDSTNQWNELSMRYEESPPDFYIPRTWRSQGTTNRQKSGDILPTKEMMAARCAASIACYEAYRKYKGLLDIGVSREQARIVLPVATYTTWVWTMSLPAALHFIRLRDHSAAQSEAKSYAQSLAAIIAKIWPVTWDIYSEMGYPSLS